MEEMIKLVSENKIIKVDVLFVRGKLESEQILLKTEDSARKVAESMVVPFFEDTFEMFKVLEKFYGLRGKGGTRGGDVIPERGNDTGEIRVGRKKTLEFESFGSFRGGPFGLDYNGSMVGSLDWKTQA